MSSNQRQSHNSASIKWYPKSTSVALLSGKLVGANTTVVADAQAASSTNSPWLNPVDNSYNMEELEHCYSPEEASLQVCCCITVVMIQLNLIFNI